MYSLFADHVVRDDGFSLRSLSITDMAIAFVILLIVVGIVIVVVKACEIPIPPWFWKILGLLALGVFAIVAIKIIVSV